LFFDKSSNSFDKERFCFDKSSNSFDKERFCFDKSPRGVRAANVFCAKA